MERYLFSDVALLDKDAMNIADACIRAGVREYRNEAPILPIAIVDVITSHDHAAAVWEAFLSHAPVEVTCQCGTCPGHDVAIDSLEIVPFSDTEVRVIVRLNESRYR